MKKHEKNVQKLAVTALVVSVIALVIACMVAFLGLREKYDQGLYYNLDSYNTMSQSYKTERITFCYENNIRPCDDDELTKWNEAHPDNTFSLAVPTPSK